jgi:hypothetical protein
MYNNPKTTHEMLDAVRPFIIERDGMFIVLDDETCSIYLKRILKQLVDDGLADTIPGGWSLRLDRQPFERRIVRLFDGSVIDLSEGGTK